MGCNFIKDEYGRTVAVVCTRDNKASKEWEEMCKELEERTQREKENDNE